jgi:hypothetical protein
MNSIKLDHQTQNFIYTTRLTSKQQAFVDSVVAGHNYIDAYKLAYDTKSSHKVMGISANALLKNPKNKNKLALIYLKLFKSFASLTFIINLSFYLFKYFLHFISWLLSPFFLFYFLLSFIIFFL